MGEKNESIKKDMGFTATKQNKKITAVWEIRLKELKKKKTKDQKDAQEQSVMHIM